MSKTKSGSTIKDKKNSATNRGRIVSKRSSKAGVSTARHMTLRKSRVKSEFLKLTTPMISRRPMTSDAHRHRLLAAMCYLWILCVVPLITNEESPYVRFHAKQGVVLALAWLVLWIVGVIPLIGWIIFFAGSIILLVINVAAIIRAWYGQEWKLPYLASYTHFVE